ncbi:MAG: sterol desaturase family protein [Pseudomonadales bacterium]
MSVWTNELEAPTTEQAPSAESSETVFYEYRSTLERILWTIAQPVLVVGALFVIASAYVYEWTNADLFALVMIVLPLPLVLVAERIWMKRTDWILEPKEFLEDVFWLATGAFIWVPLYSDYFETPISEGFYAIRDAAVFDFNLAPESMLGLVLAAILVRTLVEFIYYWLHRVQHESLLWWRIHATHHHITKMSAARGDRTHPFEWATLLLGTPIVLALTGASDGVIAVAGAFGFFNGALNHSNLPLKSLPVYDWFFATAEQHHLHHSKDLDSSNSNYGCTIIFWDRLFGTYNGSTDIEALGAGTGKPLDLWTQYKLAFIPDEDLKRL